MAHEQAGDHAGEVDYEVALAGVRGTEVHRGRKVQQQPCGDFTVFDVLANVRSVHAGGNIPVHIAHVVLGLVLAYLRQVVPLAGEQRAVIPLQDAIQAPNHLPVQALEQAIGVLGRPACDLKQRRAGHAVAVPAAA